MGAAGACKATNEGVEEEYLRGCGRLKKKNKGVMDVTKRIKGSERYGGS